MAEPRCNIIGNAASETAAFEQGADFAGMNRGTVPDAPSPIEVEVVGISEGIVIKDRHMEYGQTVSLALQESPEDIVMAQVTEDIDQRCTDLVYHGTVARPERLMEVTHRSPREKLIFYGFTPSTGMAVTGDRVVVRQDMKDSVYACRACKGQSHSQDVCTLCKGTRFEAEGVDCRLCRVQKFGTELAYSCGFVPCEHCRPATRGALANGWRAGIIIPEENQSMPITGVIVSLGPDTCLYKLGDWVQHSRYAGHHLDTREGERYCIMHEHEVLCLLKDISELRHG